VLRVERECTATEADIRAKSFNNFRMDTDAARAFWQFFEAIREAALRLNNTVFMYPVVPTHEIEANPLVRRCSVDWTFNGQPLVQGMRQRGVPAIELTDKHESARSVDPRSAQRDKGQAGCGEKSQRAKAES
jgi:hypothetical protein